MERTIKAPFSLYLGKQWSKSGTDDNKKTWLKTNLKPIITALVNEISPLIQSDSTITADYCKVTEDLYLRLQWTEQSNIHYWQHEITADLNRILDHLLINRNIVACY